MAAFTREAQSGCFGTWRQGSGSFRQVSVCCDRSPRIAGRRLRIKALLFKGPVHNCPTRPPNPNACFRVEDLEVVKDHLGAWIAVPGRASSPLLALPTLVLSRGEKMLLRQSIAHAPPAPFNRKTPLGPRNASGEKNPEARVGSSQTQDGHGPPRVLKSWIAVRAWRRNRRCICTTVASQH